MDIDDLSKILAGLGLGGTTGATITAILNSRSLRGKSRAEATELIIAAAGKVGEWNKDLNVEVNDLKYRLDSIQVALLDYLAGEMNRNDLLERVKELRK